MRGLRDQGWIASMPLGFVRWSARPASSSCVPRFTFPGLKLAELFGVDDGPLDEEIRAQHPPHQRRDHRRLRRLVNPAFTPRAADGGAPRCASFVAELFARWTRARCEAVGALAKPYPSQVIATVMGAPLEDAGRLWDWSNLIQRQFGMSIVEERAQIEQAVTEFYGTTADQSCWLAEHDDPGEDLISALIARAGTSRPRARTAPGPRPRRPRRRSSAEIRSPPGRRAGLQSSPV